MTVALIIICVVMSYLQPASFATPDNFYNITRNFSFIGIMALGMTAVIATGGIDLSVGSIMGLTAVASGLTLEAGYPGGLRWSSAWAREVLVGLVNGLIIAYLGLSPFVTTLGMLAIARSCRGGAVGQPHALQVRPGRPCLQNAGQRRVSSRAAHSTEFSAPLPHCS